MSRPAAGRANRVKGQGGRPPECTRSLAVLPNKLRGPECPVKTMRPDKSGDWYDGESRGNQWVFCADCGSQYRSETAAKLCCDRMLQAFILSRRAAAKELERYRGGYAGP